MIFHYVGLSLGTDTFEISAVFFMNLFRAFHLSHPFCRWSLIFFDIHIIESHLYTVIWNFCCFLHEFIKLFTCHILSVVSLIFFYIPFVEFIFTVIWMKFSAVFFMNLFNFSLVTSFLQCHFHGSYKCRLASSMGLFTKERITFRKPFRIVILTFPDMKAWVLPFVNAKLCQIRLLKCEKSVVLDRDRPRKPDSEDLWTQSSFRTWFVRVHFGNARWSHAWVKGSIRAVGTKYYLAVCRSCSWSGRQLQCLWTHVVQIMNPIRKRIVIQNGFRNVIWSFVNRPIAYLPTLPI